MERKILVLDDDANFLAEVAQMLRDAGYSVEVCQKSSECLWMIRKFNPDCLVLDLRMPGMRGDEILPWIRRQSPNLAVVVCTGIEDVNTAEFVHYGVKRVIQKPFAPGFLFEMLERAIHEQQLLRPDGRAA